MYNSIRLLSNSLKWDEESLKRNFSSEEFSVPGAPWCDISEMCIIWEARQRRIKRVFLSSPRARREHICEFIFEEVTVAPSWRGTPSLAWIRWQLHELMCYCFLSTLIVISEWKILYQSLWACFLLFARVGDIYLQNYCLSERENTKRDRRETKTVESCDLPCYVFCKFFGAIVKLPSDLPRYWITVIFHSGIHNAPLSTAAEPLYKFLTGS